MVTMNGINPSTATDRTTNGVSSNNISAIASALAALVQQQTKTRHADPQAADTPASQTLFTIEQIELVRRLKNSGMTKEQMIMAYDSFDRLEQELGHVYTLPVTFTQQMPHLALQPLLAQLMDQNAMETKAMGAQAMESQAIAAFTAAQKSMAQQLQAQQVQAQQAALSRKRVIDMSDSIEAESTVTPAKQHNGISQAITQPATPQTGAHSGYQTHTPGNPDLDAVEGTEEYAEFVAKGEPHCCEEIRNFVLRYTIKQQQIAVLAGISQSYVSRYFKGDFQDMSERSRRAIQKWYVMFSKNPAAIGPAANAMMLNGSPQFSGVKKFVDVNPSTDFTSYPRRERFVFRPTHLEVLESFFNIDSYPSQEKREEIARICNGSLDLSGRQLTERETVTPQVVANWFANKRKEVKKLAREEGIDPSHMYLKGRGRPSRFGSMISDLMTQNHMSPEGSNSDSDVTHQTHETSTHHDSMPDNMLNLNGQHTSVKYSNGRVETVDLLSSSSPMYHDKDFNDGARDTPLLSDALDTDAANTDNSSTRIQNQSPGDEQSLSLAVEMAAVNQAIISLSGQNPIGLKTEKMENFFP